MTFKLEQPRLTAAGVLACVALLGCGKDFDPYPRLTGLRVLAIQTNPVAPAPGETSTITPLVYIPAGKTVSYHWTWCPLPGPAAMGYPCLLDETTLGKFAAMQGADLGTVTPFDLGTGETVTFAHGINPTVLQAICSGVLSGGKTIINCDDGFPVQLKMTVTLDDGSDAVTTISTFRLRLDANGAPNTNPALDGLGVVDPMNFAAVTALDDSGTTEALRLRKTLLRASVSAASSEPYKDRDKENNLVDTAERLYISWFVESGDVDAERTSYIAGEAPIECATASDHCLTQNKWRPASPKDYAPPTSRVIAVLRDNRGGVSWKSATLKLAVAP